MSNLDAIYETIRALPIEERLRLVEPVVHDVAEVSASVSGEAQKSRASEPPAPISLLGMLEDEPELANEMCKLAIELRERSRLRITDDE